MLSLQQLEHIQLKRAFLIDSLMVCNFLFYLRAQGNLSCVGIQCKFSAKGATTKLDKGAIKTASAKFQDTVRKLIKGTL